MPRSMVGLLVAVATAMPALVAFTHGVLIGMIIMVAAAAAGLAAFASAPAIKKISNRAPLGPVAIKKILSCEILATLQGLKQLLL